MNNHAHNPALRLPRRWLRRVVGLFCALSFLFVTFAHDISHNIDANYTAQAFISAPKGASDISSDLAKLVAVSHCHTCSVVAMVAPEATLATIRVISPVPMALAEEHLPPLQNADTPPPKVTI